MSMVHIKRISIRKDYQTYEVRFLNVIYLANTAKLILATQIKP